MMQKSNGDRRTVNWPAIGVAIVVSALVIGGSIGLVRYRNRNRGATQPVFWAVADLAAAPDSVVTRVVSLSSYHTALGNFRTALTERRLSVDSIRDFYHAYTLWSRNGVLEVHEIRACLPYLGLTPSAPVPQNNSDSLFQAAPDSTIRDAG